MTILIDLEDRWGSPCSTCLDIDSAMESIREILKRNRVRAVFNTCGKIMEEKPSLIQELCSEGHEIAAHGWAHEKFLALSRNEFAKVLLRTEMAFERAVGEKLLGMRPPSLMAIPDFGVEVRQPIRAVLRQISQRGYIWISYRKIVFTEEWKNYLSTNQSATELSRLRRALLSAKVVFNEKTFRRAPRVRQNMLDIPLTTSMDCDILGLPAPADPTSQEQISAYLDILERQIARSGTYSNLNFHEWIIGNSNRPFMLQRILDSVNKNPKCTWVLPSEIAKVVHL